MTRKRPFSATDKRLKKLNARNCSSSMRGIAAFPRQTAPQIVEVDEPSPPAAGEVLCRTLALGICGTDREILRFAEPLRPEGEDYLILGHECLAQVEQVGSDVTGLAEGDFVVPVVRRSTSQRSHRSDMLSFGEYVERGIVRLHGFSVPLWKDRPEHLFRVEPLLAPYAVLAEPITCAEKAINEALVIERARLGPDTWDDPPPRVLITGMGPIGFGALLVCHTLGWPVTVYGRDDPDSARATLAVDFGATYLQASPRAFAVDDVERSGFDLVLECTGAVEVLLAATEVLASCGVMAWLGSQRASRAVEANVAQVIRHGVLRNHVHLGVVNAAPGDFHDALADLEYVRRRTPELLDRLITERVGMDEALWHYNHRRPQGIKTVIMYP